MVGSAGEIPFHEPVLLAETLEALAVRSVGVYVDGTVGEGGHTLGILEAAPLTRVLCIDLNPRAVALAKRRLSRYQDRFVAVQGNYVDMEVLATRHGFTRVDGVLLDLGFSSLQIESEGYGFSFRRDEPLDMRYDPAASLTAADLVNSWSEPQLARIIFQFGEEPRARSVARAIVRGRPMQSTKALADLVAQALGGARGRVHPATRTFQALRIAVNQELDNVKRGLVAAVNTLRRAGRLVVIGYHSLEDRAVKDFLVRESTGCICPPGVPECRCGHQPTVRLIGRKVIKPPPEEVRSNQRSRSAKLRVAERL